MLQASFEFAEILHASHDFLARITALLEAHAAECLQIDHLRDEQLARAAEDLANPGADLIEQPAVDWHLAKLRAQAGANLLGFCFRCPEFGPAIGQSDGDQAIAAHDAVRCLG